MSSQHIDINSSPNANVQNFLEQTNLIDQSINKAVLYFILSSVTWLLIGSILALFSSVKLIQPNFFTFPEGFTFGRIEAMVRVCFLMGWCSNSIYAVSFWLMARLSSTPIKHGSILLIAGFLWNLAVTISIIGIFIGDMTGFNWVEFPSYTSGVYLLAYTFIGVWGIVAFKDKKNNYSYVSQWYILGALLWYPWIFVIGQFFLNWFPLRGVMQPIVHTWYVNNIFYLWLSPIALATCYYLIPKLSNIAIQSYHLSSLAFWTFVTFASWSSMSFLIGAPIPVWLTTTSIVFSISLLLPMLIFAINLLGPYINNSGEFKKSIPLGFILFASFSFLLLIGIKIFTSLTAINAITHFTIFQQGHDWHMIYGFFSMAMFGFFYYLTPILLNNDWCNHRLIKLNLYSSIIGIIILLTSHYLGGFLQGLSFNDPKISFLEISINLHPWFLLKFTGTCILFLSNCIFVINIINLVIRTFLKNLPRLNVNSSEASL